MLGLRVFSITLAAACVALGQTPPQATPQSATDDNGITVNAGRSLRHRAPVHYPRGVQVVGTVQIEASVNTEGDVTDAHVVSGPEELRKDALWSVLQWHYAPGAASPVQVSIRFDAPAVPTSSANPQQSPPVDDFLSGIVKRIEFIGISQQEEGDLRAKLPLHEGDSMFHSDFARVDDTLREFDNHLRSEITGQIAAPDAHRDLTIRIRAIVQAGTEVFVKDQPEAAPKPSVSIKK